MGNIAKAATSEIGFTTLPFLGDKGCDRGGKGYKAVPKQNRRDVKNMGKEYAFYTKMAEEGYRIGTLIFHSV